MQDDFAKDVTAVGRIDAVQTILEVVCRTTGMGFSAVARVTESRWIACAVRDEIAFGLQPGGELEVQTTICDEIRCSHQAVVIDHVAEDEVFRDHHTPKKYGFQSYASFPIMLPDGRFFGTLCAIDPRPAKLNRPEILGMFKLFASLIAMHLDSLERVAASEAALLDAREAAQLREQFIAVLGHDLRNPLSALQSAVQLLNMISSGGVEEREVLDVMQRSTKRMSGLISDVLDFARGRLGGGLTITMRPRANLAEVLKHVVVELQTSSPTRTIDFHLDLPRPVSCDSARISQMLSNLLSNALTHGDPSGPINVDVKAPSDAFELSVSNRGQIPDDILHRLFEPFSRGADRAGQEGLGLGLYIATEIAKAHHGTLGVTSVDNLTRFTFRMPAVG